MSEHPPRPERAPRPRDSAEAHEIDPSVFSTEGVPGAADPEAIRAKSREVRTQSKSRTLGAPSANQNAAPKPKSAGGHGHGPKGFWGWTGFLLGGAWFWTWNVTIRNIIPGILKGAAETIRGEKGHKKAANDNHPPKGGGGGGHH